LLWQTEITRSKKEKLKKIVKAILPGLQTRAENYLPAAVLKQTTRAGRIAIVPTAKKEPVRRGDVFNVRRKIFSLEIFFFAVLIFLVNCC
jgi:hypothetical protein